jgi:hypothetical protein
LCNKTHNQAKEETNITVNETVSAEEKLLISGIMKINIHDFL